LENKIFDDVLSEALKDNLGNRMAELPSEEELEALYPSLPELDRKMGRHFRRAHRNRRPIRQKAAVIVLICVSIIGVCLSSSSVRAATQRFFLTVFDSHITFSAWEQNAITLQKYKIGYMPKGYSLADAFEADDTGIYSYIFEDSNGNAIFLDYSPIDASVLGFDNERFEMEQIRIGKYDGYFFESGEQERILLWSDDLNFFCLTSALPRKEMIKIAASIHGHSGSN